MALKENRVVLLARNETTYGVDAIAAAIALNASDPTNNPHPFITDAILCSEFDVGTDADVLERGNYSPSLSVEASGIARVLARFSFRTELRSSGVLGVAPRIGRLLKAAGMAETIIPATAAAQIGTPVAGPGSSSAGLTALMAAITKTTAPTQMHDTYRVTVTTGGATGVAQALVTSAGFPDYESTLLHSTSHQAITNSAAGVVTIGGTVIAPTITLTGAWAVNDYIELYVGGIRFYDQVVQGDTLASIATRIAAAVDADARITAAAAAGVITVGLSAGAGPKPLAAGAFALGSSGAVVTIGAWAGSVNVGESFEVSLRRSGVRYDPISDDGASVTLWAFLDGALFRLRGARGSWAATGEAARYPGLAWTFTGNYVDPIDQAMPTTLQFEESKPYKVEVAELAIFGLANNLACASRFAMDIANEVAVRECINAEEAYDGVQIVSRAPTAGADPEAYKPSVYNPWSRLRRGDTTRFSVIVGKKGGAANTIRLQADAANYTGAPFAARNRIRSYDLGLRLARKSALGDDELSLHFG